MTPNCGSGGMKETHASISYAFLWDFFNLPEPRDLDDYRLWERHRERLCTLNFDADRRTFDREHFLTYGVR